MSIAGGTFNAFTEGERKGCRTIQIFVKASNQWQAKPLTDAEIRKFHEEQKRTGIEPVIAHDSYLINLASPDKNLLDKSRKAFLVEMERCRDLGIYHLVTHPGSHMQSGESEGIRRVGESLGWLFERTDGFDVFITLEITAGQGTNLGHKFDQLAKMIELSGAPERCRVCFDTAHAFAAGYDIASPEGYRQTWAEFERIIGLDMLAAIHLNDSKKGLGSRVDRHDHIGKGALGLGAFRMIMNDSKLVDIPKILETPKGDEDEMDEVNLALLRKLASDRG